VTSDWCQVTSNIRSQMFGADSFQQLITPKYSISFPFQQPTCIFLPQVKAILKQYRIPTGEAFATHIMCVGDRGSTVFRALCYKSEGCWFDPTKVSLEFFINTKSFRSHHGPEVDSTSNRNEYQAYFLGGKGCRCVRLTTLPPSWAVVM